MLTGVYLPTEGQLQVLGSAPQDFDEGRQRQIGYMPQSFSLYPHLTVWHNLSFAASLYGMPIRRRARLNEVLAFVELESHKRKLARDISGGMRRRLSLASTLVHNPELVFLDEPTAGIDPILRRRFWDHFHTLKSQGHTIFVSTQYVGEAVNCDTVAILAQGRLVAVQSPQELRRLALGGDRLLIELKEPINSEQMLEFDLLPLVVEGSLEMHGTELRLAVEDAARAIPPLMSWFHARQIEIISIGHVHPSFNEVFVRLIEDQTLQKKEEALG
jgi:ABC-2 type transport system ATP-binding protein